MKSVWVASPPIVSTFDGKLCVEVIFDAPDGEKYFIRAPIGNGAWFAQQVMERVVKPALLERAERQGKEAGSSPTGRTRYRTPSTR
jgi:hypothetical protein